MAIEDSPREGSLTNWAGSHTYTPARFHRPRTVAELSEIVASADRVRAQGSRHSFSDLGDTSGDLVSTLDLPRDIDIDESRKQVRVAGGVLYGELAPELHRRGWALAAMASLPHISVAGAVATGTHGSGNKVGSLSSAVASLQYVAPDGELRVVSRGDEDFEGHVVALGALGVVTHLTLDLQPTYEVRQDMFLRLPWDVVMNQLDEITGAAYSVSLFTDWVGDAVSQVWLKSRLDQGTASFGRELLGATAATEAVHMLRDAPTGAVTSQLGKPGSWDRRLPHFRMEFTPSRGAELQSEYILPRDQAVTAFERMRGLGPRLAELLQVSEIRTVAADRLWLSGAYGTDVVALHFTWVRDVPAVIAVLPAMEAALLPLGARPHWGKLFTAGPDDLALVCPELARFQGLRRRVDPDDKFGNPFLDRHLGPTG